MRRKREGERGRKRERGQKISQTYDESAEITEQSDEKGQGMRMRCMYGLIAACFVFCILFVL